MSDIGEQLADDEYSPAVGKELRRSGHWTVLTVNLHVLIISRFGSTHQSDFGTSQGSRSHPNRELHQGRRT
jgi:hypothetical protein